MHEILGTKTETRLLFMREPGFCLSNSEVLKGYALTFF